MHVIFGGIITEKDDNKYRLPTTYVYFDPSDPGYGIFRHRPLSGSTPDITYIGVDRLPDTNAIQAGILSKIKYPSGGEVEYVYEPNTYYDHVANQTYDGGGLRIKQLITRSLRGQGGIQTHSVNYDYNLSNGQSSGVMISRPQFARFNHTYPIANLSSTQEKRDSALMVFEKPINQITDYDGSYIGYTNVEVSQIGNGKTRYQYHRPRTFINETPEQNLLTSELEVHKNQRLLSLWILESYNVFIKTI